MWIQNSKRTNTSVKKTQVLHFSIRNVRYFCLFSDCWVIRVCIQDFLCSHSRWNINSQLEPQCFINCILTLKCGDWLSALTSLSVVVYLRAAYLIMHHSLQLPLPETKMRLSPWVYRRKYGFQVIRYLFSGHSIYVFFVSGFLYCTMHISGHRRCFKWDLLH